MNWTRDLPGESKMKQLGVEWSVNKDGIPIAEINWELSLAHQARIGKKVNEDWVTEMANAALAGNEFPMIIVQKEKGYYIIHSGIHRASMARSLGELVLPCYMVRITDERILDVFPRAINTANGHPEGREATIEHAKYIIERHGYPTESVAKWLGLKPDWIVTALRAGQVENRLAEIGIKTVFPKTTLIALSPLAGNNNVLKAVVKLLKDKDLAGDRAKQVIDDTKRGQTERAQIAEIDRWRKMLEEREPKPAKTAGAPNAVRQNRGKFFDMLTRLERFLEHVQNPGQLQLDDSDAAIAAQSWQKIESKMNSLMKGVGK